MALIIAVLYFGLMELMLYDAQRQLAEARRFRARVMALTLAENGAELAARFLLTSTPSPAPAVEDWQGTSSGTIVKSAGRFRIDGTGNVTGIVPMGATVSVQGRYDETAKRINIDYTRHKP